MFWDVFFKMVIPHYIFWPKMTIGSNPRAGTTFGFLQFV